MSKHWIKAGLLKSGIMRLAARGTQPSAAILMYHSVMEDPRSELQTLGGIIHSKEVFSKQMELLAREYVPISLDDLLRAVVEGKSLRPRSVVVTFDDGYSDNHEMAMPILNRVGVPSTFYITVDCVEGGKLPWPSRLRYAFFTSGEVSWNDINKDWPLTNPGERDSAFLYACDLCAKLAGEAQEKFVHQVEDDLAIDPFPSSRNLMMSWDQVRDLAKNGHIVGSHTLTHPNMAYVDAEAAKAELGQSKQRLEAVLGAPVVHFSYPCPALVPHWSESTRTLSRDVGYRTAVTTTGGAVHAGDDPLSLKRVRPSKDLEGLRWNLECTFLGRAM
jgi:peptidoglycan/xylan/chitin deacetylase (PgdA/CDA1 family)